MVSDQEEDVKSLTQSIKKDKQESDFVGPILGDREQLRLEKKISKYKKEEGEIKNGKLTSTGFCRSPIKTKMNNDTKRVCHVCNKAFSSGKALGGHMRIHVQESNFRLKTHQPIKFKKRYPREERVIISVKNKSAITHHSYGGTGSGTNKSDVIKKQICLICCKKFPSMKSLYGHMRTHPEREWRGVQPPPKMNNYSSSSSSSHAEEEKIDDDRMEFLAANGKIKAVNLVEALKGWPATARRFRKSGAAAVNSELSMTAAEEEEDDVDDRLRDAVNDLLMLSRGSIDKYDQSHQFDDQIADSNPKKKQKVDLSLVENHEEKAGSNEVEKTVVGMGQAESVNKLEIDDEDAEYFDKCSYTSNDHELNKDSKNKKRIRKKMKLCDLDVQLQLPQKAEASISTMATSASGKYKCNNCDKRFQTYQALGGHRSSHKKFKLVIHNSIDFSHDQAEAVVSPGEGSQTCHRVLGFDLNEMPPSDQEENGGFDSDHLNFVW